jgi:ribonuclease P protein component
MPAIYRLTRADFKLFSVQKSHRVRGSFFTLATTPLLSSTSPKTACIVSKKVAKSAVDRNRIKRRVRAILTPLMPYIKDRVALVFYAHTGSSVADFGDLSKDILQLLRSGGYLV